MKNLTAQSQDITTSLPACLTPVAAVGVGSPNRPALIKGEVERGE